MSSVAHKKTLDQAGKEAVAFRGLFDGCFSRWRFAGSLRRQRSQVGDIEHVVIPRFTPDPEGLLIHDAHDCNILRRMADRLLRDGTLALHDYGGGNTRNGDKYMGFDFRGGLHEIFSAAANFGCILAIRTGSADFSRGLMIRLRDRGYRQCEGYLWRIVACDRSGGDDRRLFDDGQCGERVDCPDEDVMLRAAGLNPTDWPPPRREAAP